MELKGTHRFNASPQAVWDALHNSATLQKCVPGAQEISWQGENTVHAFFTVGIGPFAGHGVILDAQVTEHTAPSHLKLAVDRHGSHGSAEGGITIDLRPDGAGTVLEYGGAVSLGGPAALLDNPLSRPLVNAQLGHFFTNLEQQIR